MNNPQWPRLIREIKVKPFLDGESHKSLVNSWDDIERLSWIQSMNLKRTWASKDGKYILGEKQSGHNRLVGWFFSTEQTKEIMNEPLTFGEQMWNERKRQGLSATSLAKELNIARSHLYSLEKGEITNPSMDLAHRICKILNIPHNLAIGDNHLRFKKLLADATLPTKAYDTDSGMDLYAAYIKKENPGELWFGTGIAVEIPVGFSGLIFPRSSISKVPLSLANAVGVIDPGYRGEIQVRFNRIDSTHKQEADYKIGDRVAQLIIVQVPCFKPVWAEELDNSERGADGFGSSGK